MSRLYQRSSPSAQIIAPSSANAHKGLVCPMCRGNRDGGFLFWPLTSQKELLCCTNPTCRTRYTTVPYPIVLREPGVVLDRFLELPGILPNGALSLMLRTLPTDGPIFEALCKRSTYLWAHFHDLLPEDCRPDVAHPAPFAQRALALLDDTDLPANARALVAGCGPGREAMELALRLQLNAENAEDTGGDNDAPQVVAMDLDPILLNDITLFQDERRLSFLLRASTRSWHTPHTLTLPDPLVKAARMLDVVCADILDPPFGPDSFDIVVALNLFDNVRDPLLLLAQLYAIIKPGGYLLISTPFAWNDRITPPQRQPAQALPRLTLTEPMRLEKLLSGTIPMGVPVKFQCVAVSPKATWSLRIHDTHLQTYLPYLGLWQKPAEANESVMAPNLRKTQPSPKPTPPPSDPDEVITSREIPALSQPENDDAKDTPPASDD